MSLPLKSQQELYDLWITTLQNDHPELSDTLPGSVIDALAGVFSISAMELQRYIIQQFNKTFFTLASGPEVTGGPDDLATLAVDHFGSSFARPAATAAVDTATFSRPTAAAGLITIPMGTVIKTKPDANGNVYRYLTNSLVTLTASGGGSLSVSVGVTAQVAGSASNAVAGALNVIESTLLDPTIVVTNTGNATGTDALDDADYRIYIQNLITALRAATKAAIVSTALTVPGVTIAVALEIEQAVSRWNIAANAPLDAAIGGLYQWFYIPYVTLYIADHTGTANSTLVAEVAAAIDPVRALGVYVSVLGATPVTVNWTGTIVLNPSGPNYGTLSSDTSVIIKTMKNYINTLGPGVNFVRSTANAAMLAIFGPSGTNDITSFTTSVPSGDITITTPQIAVAGTVTLV